MCHSWFDTPRLCPWLWSLLLISAQPAAQTPDPDPRPTEASPPASGLIEPLRQERDAAFSAAESPPVACYRAAREGSGDAYVCDLAVQMARDGGTPALAAALTNRALVLAREGRLEPALQDLNEAIAQTPNDPALYGNLGNLLLRLGRPRAALAAHDRAVELAPDDPRGFYNRAFSYLALAEPLLAEQDVAAARALLGRRPTAVTGPDTAGRVELRGR